MRRMLHGLDELAIETAFIGVSALVFIVVAAYALNSAAASRLEGVPLVGAAVGAARTLVGQVANS
ncbi:MAG: hypothetical protein KGL54_10775 [Sphingomonadales bacterium]|nr:hypothetical protein [Sphingomonadales bacterium]